MKNRLTIVRAALEDPTPQPALVTMPNIELLEVGEDWETSTGKFTFTAEDLVSCIQSQEDPAIRTPVLKLGHVDPRFDGQPAFGRVENLRLTNNNQTLVGDYVAMPLWLAQVMFSAFPRRSIEGRMDYRSQTNNTWPMILTGVALLGDAYPAIDTLEDIQTLWGATPPILYPVEDVEEIAASGSFFRARKVDDMKTNWLRKKDVAAAAPSVKASVGLDNIRMAFYDTLGPGQEWWWIREIRVNPMALIVDDDEGSLWEVPVTVSAADEITFGDPVEVKVQYVAASGAPVAEVRAGQVVAASHESPEDTGRTSRTEPDEDATLSDSSGNTDPEEENFMLTDEALRALGLEPGATQEEISAAIVAKTTASAATDPDPDPDPVTEPDPDPDPELVIPEGMVLVDAATLKELKTGVAAATDLVQRQAQKDRDDILASAIRAGKFPKARRAHYEKLLCSDPEGTKAMIESLEPGLVPVAETGEQGSEVAAAAEQSAYPSGWKRSVEAGRKSGDRIKVVQD